jgi:hypothetical protein
MILLIPFKVEHTLVWTVLLIVSPEHRDQNPSSLGLSL